MPPPGSILCAVRHILQYLKQRVKGIPQRARHPLSQCAAKMAAFPVSAPLAACLDAKAKMTTEFFIEIAKLKPGIAFFRDDAFVDDSARTNLQLVFNQFSPTTSIKVI